jgi:hypothetical protein
MGFNSGLKWLNSIDINDNSSHAKSGSDFAYQESCRIYIQSRLTNIDSWKM